MMMNNDSILVNNTPSDWSVKKIKYVFDERKESNDPVKTDVLVSLTHDRGVILHSDKGDIGNKAKDDLTRYKLVYPGDIVVNSMNVIIGSSGLSNYYGLVSPVYYMLRTKDPSYDKKFFHYLFRSIVFQKSLIGVGNGILEHRMRIPMDKLGSQFIPLPPSTEQKLISQYLDKKIDQIDTLIEKTQKKIKLLKEQQTSLINQYITKGLDQNVEMKNSGYDWIGEIPKHWQVIKINYIMEVKDGTHDTPDYLEKSIDTFPLVTSSNFVEGKIDFSNCKHISLEDYLKINKRSNIETNDIIMSMIGSNLGNTAIVGEDIKFSIKNVCLFKTSSCQKVSPSYLFFLIESNYLTCQIDVNQKGGGQPFLSLDNLRNLKFPIPPKDEQKDIISKLSKQKEPILKLLKSETKKIDLLKEYRQSITSSVVTGKVRVSDDII